MVRHNINAHLLQMLKLLTLTSETVTVINRYRCLESKSPAVKDQ